MTVNIILLLALIFKVGLILRKCCWWHCFKMVYVFLVSYNQSYDKTLNLISHDAPPPEDEDEAMTSKQVQ